MAVGKARQGIQQDKLSISINDIPVSDKGRYVAESHEDTLEKTMQNTSITLAVDLDMGDAEFTAWTCDFTHDYISINADYRS